MFQNNLFGRLSLARNIAPITYFNVRLCMYIINQAGIYLDESENLIMIHHLLKYKRFT